MDNIEKLIPPYSEKIKDSYMVKILLCFFLYKIKKHVTPNQLMEIATSNDIVNYFAYTEAINDLISAKSIEIIENDGEEYFHLTELGEKGAMNFKDILPKSLREEILTAGMRLFAQLKKNHDVKCEISQADNGFYVHLICLDMGNVLMDIELFTPNIEQAEFMKEKLLLDPTVFYGNVLDFALDVTKSEIEYPE